MLQYRHIYFNLRGRGEVVRLLFAYTGQKYDDVKVAFKSEEWAKLKPTVPLGTLPVLEIKDTTTNQVTRLSQSRAIGRYLANKFQLAGKSDLEKAKADEIVDQVNDEIDMFVAILNIKEKEKKVEQLKKMSNQVMPLNLKYFENTLAQNKTGYLVGNGLTWADFAVMAKWDDLPKKEPVLKNFPLVKQHDERIRSIPQISDYLKNRPVTKI